MTWKPWKKREKEESSSTLVAGNDLPLLEQIDRLIIFLIGRLTPQQQTQSCREYLERLLKAPAEVRYLQLCQAFCLAEYTLIHLDTQCKLGRKSLREMARLKFPDAHRIPDFEIVLVAPLEQEHIFCSYFLQLLLDRLQRFFGTEQKFLAGFRNRIDMIDLDASLSPSPALYQEVSMELYHWATKRMGAVYVEESYQQEYQRCIEQFGILEESQILLFLLPEEIMTPYQLSLFMQLGKSW